MVLYSIQGKSGKVRIDMRVLFVVIVQFIIKLLPLILGILAISIIPILIGYLKEAIKHRKYSCEPSWIDTWRPHCCDQCKFGKLDNSGEKWLCTGITEHLSPDEDTYLPWYQVYPYLPDEDTCKFYCLEAHLNFDHLSER